MDINTTQLLTISSPVFNLLFPFITAIATSFTAYLVWRASRPSIAIWTEFDKNENLTMDLIIENVGQSSARDVKFEVIPDFEIIPGRFLSQTGLFRTGLKSFSSHRKIILFLTWMPENYEKKIEKPFKIKVTYKGIFLKYSNEFDIDFFFFGEVPLPPSPLCAIAQNIEKMQNSIHSITQSSREIHVVTQSENEYHQKIVDEIAKIKNKNDNSTKASNKE